MAKFIPVEPFDIVIFGGTGDLSRRKLLPALFHRWLDGQIPESSCIVGTARSEMDSKEYRKMAKEACESASGDNWDAKEWTKFEKLIHYVSIDATQEDADWATLKSFLTLDDDRPCVFYLATSPRLYVQICQALGKAGLSHGNTRVVLEKPIGTDLESAKAINDGVAKASSVEIFMAAYFLLGKMGFEHRFLVGPVAAAHRAGGYFAVIGRERGGQFRAVRHRQPEAQQVALFGRVRMVGEFRAGVQQAEIIDELDIAFGEFLFHKNAGSSVSPMNIAMASF